MTDSKAQRYRDEADRCRQLAASESCPDAREYYEALSRDYVKLAEAEARGV
jgi:hypothetical protein